MRASWVMVVLALPSLAAGGSDERYIAKSKQVEDVRRRAHYLVKVSATAGPIVTRRKVASYVDLTR